MKNFIKDKLKDKVLNSSIDFLFNIGLTLSHTTFRKFLTKYFIKINTISNNAFYHAFVDKYKNEYLTIYKNKNYLYIDGYDLDLLSDKPIEKNSDSIKYSISSSFERNTLIKINIPNTNIYFYYIDIYTQLTESNSNEIQVIDKKQDEKITLSDYVINYLRKYFEMRNTYVLIYKKQDEKIIFDFIENIIYESYLSYFNDDYSNLVNIYNIDAFSSNALSFVNTKTQANTIKLSKLITYNDINLKIFESIIKFSSSKDNYNKFNRIYKKGYLFLGHKGTGKTTLIKSISSAMRYGILNIPLSSLTNKEFIKLIFNINDYLVNSRNGLSIIFEDIDRVFHLDQNITNVTDPISFDVLLNFIDGLNSPSKCLFFLTANNLDRIEPTLIRKNRIDEIYYIEPFSNIEATKYILKSFEMENNKIQEERLLTKLEGCYYIPATLEKYVLDYIDNYEDFFNFLDVIKHESKDIKLMEKN